MDSGRVVVLPPNRLSRRPPLGGRSSLGSTGGCRPRSARETSPRRSLPTERCTRRRVRRRGWRGGRLARGGCHRVCSVAPPSGTSASRPRGGVPAASGERPRVLGVGGSRSLGPVEKRRTRRCPRRRSSGISQFQRVVETLVRRLNRGSGLWRNWGRRRRRRPRRTVVFSFRRPTRPCGFGTRSER